MRQRGSPSFRFEDDEDEWGRSRPFTRRGRAVGILAPPSFVAPVVKGAGDLAWARLNRLADDLGRNRGKRASALRELTRMRR